MEPYTYQPLGDNEIRLFEMDLAASKKDRIAGCLRVVRLQEENRKMCAFAALSYAWGRTYPDRSHLSERVICDGLRLDVTPNLKQALLRIRQLNKVQETPHPSLSRLWIDAMCINQEDLNERSKQVQIMASIYHNSSDLLVWLGEFEPSNLGDLQSEMLGRFYAHGDNLRSILSNGAKPYWTYEKFRRLGKEIAGRHHHSSVSDWRVLDSILASPWFNRRWVIQECEMASSESTHFLMGGAAVHCRNFEALLDSFASLQRAPPLNPPKQRLDVLQGCCYYEASQCSDPRDVVYAILHLCSDGEKVEVDYTKNVRLTYLGLVERTVFDITASLDSAMSCAREAATERPSVPDIKIVSILLLALARGDPAMDPPLEQWVPDWRVKPAFKSASHRMALKRCTPLYQDTDAGQVSWAIQMARDGHHFLRLKGSLVDRMPYDNIASLSKQSSVPVQARPYLGLLSELRREYPAIMQPEDRTWLAYSRVNKPERGFVIAVLLRPSDGTILSDQLPVYKMQDCMVLYEYGHPSYMDIRRRLISLRGWEPSLKRDLEQCGILVDKEFYLE